MQQGVKALPVVDLVIVTDTYVTDINVLSMVKGNAFETQDRLCMTQHNIHISCMVLKRNNNAAYTCDIQYKPLGFSAYMHFHAGQ